MLSIPWYLLLMLSSEPSAEWEALRLAEESRTGRLIGLSAEGALLWETGDPTPRDRWYALRRVGIPRPDMARTPHVELVNGDRLAGTILQADDDAIQFRLAASSAEKPLRLPLSSVRFLWLVQRPARDPAWPEQNRTRDLFQTRGGDRVTGTLTRIDSAQNRLVYQAEGKELQLELSRLSAIAFNPELARIRKPKGPYHRLTLTDGSRWSVASISWEDDAWRVGTLNRETVRLPLESLLAIDVEQGPAVWLADLKPAEVLQTGDFREPIALGVNRCISGDLLRLLQSGQEATFDRGIGLAAEQGVRYGLSGRYQRFEALAGLDARSGTRGDARLIIRVDGKEQLLPGNGRITMKNGPIPLRLSVAGAKELTITIDPGNGGPVQDHVNLVEARLIP